MEEADVNWKAEMLQLVKLATGEKDLDDAWLAVGDRTKKEILAAFWKWLDGVAAGEKLRIQGERERRENETKVKQEWLSNLPKIYGSIPSLAEDEVVSIYVANSNVGFDLAKKKEKEAEFKLWLLDWADQGIIGWTSVTDDQFKAQVGSAASMVLLMLGDKPNPNVTENIREMTFPKKAPRGRGRK